MDPRDPQPRTAPGQTPGQPEPIETRDTPPRPNGAGTVPARRMDPRLWALLPIIALAILGAYMAGKGFREAPPQAPTMTATEQPVAKTPPPPPPRGNITVTEVPHPATVTPPPGPTPAPPTLGKRPTPPQPKREAYRQEEQPFVLTPPEPEPTEPEPEIMPPEPPEETGGETGVNEPPAAPSEPDRDPVKLNDPALEYPASAYEAGVEGTTRVSFSVTPDGRVEDAQVSQSSGDSRLDQAALDYVRRLRFRPAVRNGKPSTVRANRTVRFQLR